MNKDTKNLFTGLLGSAVIVITVAFAASVARADGPPEQVLSNLETIEANQEILAETREAHEAFLKAKAENEQLERQNNSLGWKTNWSTMKPVPVEPSFLQPL